MDQVNLTDALTGLYNRRGLEVSIQQLVIQENEVSVIFLDIDYFKLVNDTYGHDTGDIVIKAIALLIQRLSRSTDIVCRYGGEGFVILLPATGLLLAAEVAERLRKQAQNLNICNNSINITISLGVSYWRPEMNKTIEDAIKLADQALYSAKQQGRNRIVVSD